MALLSEDQYKKILKLCLILLICIFFLGLLMMNIAKPKSYNPLLDYAKENCYNYDEILKQEFIEGKTYNIMESETKDSKSYCVFYTNTELNFTKWNLTTIKH